MTQHNKEIQREKDLLLEKLLDPDAILTDAELEMILADDELREIYEVSAAVRGACLQPSEIDVGREWRLFRHKLRPKPSPWRWMMRVAAIFLGVLFVFGIVKYAIDRMLTGEKPVVVAESKSSSVKGPEVGEDSDNKNEPVSELIPVVEEAPAVAVRKVRNKRPIPVETEDEEEDIDIDEYLRLQQARIDNDLALLKAQIYIEELQALDVSFLKDGEYEEPKPQEVRYIIMQ